MPDNNDSYQKNSIFSVEHLSFSYKNKIILRDINFALFPGQRIGLYGPNGSGKTTFFRCVTGLNKANGIIRLGTEIIKNEKDFHKLRCRVGYALQNADDQIFFPTVSEDLAFGPLNLGLSPAETKGRVEESLAIMGLQDFANRLSHELSGGEKKRVALASILAMHPQALLLDEPDNELDEQGRTNLIGLIHKLECAKMIISHDPEFLQETCQQIIKLENGYFV